MKIAEGRKGLRFQQNILEFDQLSGEAPVDVTATARQHLFWVKNWIAAPDTVIWTISKTES